jgi:Protein phosphatase 2C
MKRVDGDLAVSRALGDFQYKDNNLPPEKCKVSTFIIKLTGVHRLHNVHTIIEGSYVARELCKPDCRAL